MTGPRPCGAPGNCGCWRPGAPAPYLIRINGHLGATMLSAFPALAQQHHGAHTVLTGLDLLEIRKLTPGSTPPKPGHHRPP